MPHPYTKTEILLEYSVDLVAWHGTFAIPGAETTQKHVRTVFMMDGKRWMPGMFGSCVVGYATGPRPEDIVFTHNLTVDDLDTAPLR